MSVFTSIVRSIFGKNHADDVDDPQQTNKTAQDMPANNAEILHVNDRVQDSWGRKGVITHIDPKAEHL